MADPRVLSRRDSHSHSEASNADSSSTSMREPEPDTRAAHAPVVRSEPVGQRATIVPPAHALPRTASSAPLAAIAARQPASGITSGTTIPGVASPEWGWDAPAGILTLNKIFCYMDEIRTLLKNYPGVQHIVVQPNFVLDAAVGLIESLGAATNITSIHFRRPKNASLGYDDSPYLSADSARALADLAKKNPALGKLVFSDGSCQPNFLNALAHCLKDNLTVEAIEIYDYDIDRVSSIDVGIAELLTHANGIQSLLAPSNFICSGGAAIGAALATNRSLTKLDLGRSVTESEDAKALFDGLRKNRKSVLSTLNLSHCKMDKRSAKSLDKLLKQKTSIKEIIVGYPGAPDESKYFSKEQSANKSGTDAWFVRR